MKNFPKILIFLILAVFLVVGNATALPINPRGGPIDPNTVNTSLQDNLDAHTVDGPGIDAVNDQVNYAIFTNDASGAAIAALMFEIAAYQGTNEFGIYAYGDPSNRAEIFDGSAGAGSQAFVSFLANGDVMVNGSLVATGLGNIFGFYLDVYEAAADNGGDSNSNTLDYTVFTEDDQNPAGDPYALVFQGDDETVLQIDPWALGVFGDNEFIIAFEDLRIDMASDQDYSDMVVLVESIRPIPEPATMLLFGSGLIGLAVLGRKKFFKKS